MAGSEKQLVGLTWLAKLVLQPAVHSYLQKLQVIIPVHIRHLTARQSERQNVRQSDSQKVR